MPRHGRTITGAPVYVGGRIRLPHAKGYYEFAYGGPLPQTPSNLAAVSAKLDRLIALLETASPPPAGAGAGPPARPLA